MAGAAALAMGATVALTAGGDGEQNADPPPSSAPPATQAAPSSVPTQAPTAVPSPVRSSGSTAMPSDAVKGLPDPDGPTPFTPCTANEVLSVGFSPEGYALLCTHVPGTRTYEWRPAP
ncbi:hypothetical protein [Streptomyces sp. ISL-86]|uniref:hypothetical protein n=1 Tax=Streptomyces sp. ISL-86 TaxID=2819187 RepID=UPI001BECFD59|nr:hypothetical protein [Streptomyces sp. ISL-86]MBT2459580.1 hypothetical protein [Streptomyces sp. ISL-86]